MTEISGPDFITLLVSDLDASFRFYTQQLGFTESSEKRPNAHAFDTKPCGIAIRQSPERWKPEHPGQGVLVWFRTADATSLHRELKQRGVPVAEELRNSPFGMTFSVRDPDGYILNLHDGG